MESDLCLPSVTEPFEKIPRDENRNQGGSKYWIKKKSRKSLWIINDFPSSFVSKIFPSFFPFRSTTREKNQREYFQLQNFSSPPKAQNLFLSYIFFPLSFFNFESCAPIFLNSPPTFEAEFKKKNSVKSRFHATFPHFPPTLPFPNLCFEFSLYIYLFRRCFFSEQRRGGCIRLHRRDCYERSDSAAHPQDFTGGLRIAATREKIYLTRKRRQEDPSSLQGSRRYLYRVPPSPYRGSTIWQTRPPVDERAVFEITEGRRI